MAQRGKPSIAHEYAANEQCIHCGMYRNVVQSMSHVCRPWRELDVDMREATKAGKSLWEYQLGDQVGVQ